MLIAALFVLVILLCIFMLRRNKNRASSKTDLITAPSVNQKEVENKSTKSQKKDIVKRIPEYRKNLLFITDDDPKNFVPPTQFVTTVTISLNPEAKDGFDFDFYKSEPSEPSLIFTALPVCSECSSIEDVPKLPYFPTYFGMSAEQRFIYLNWLRDITSPVDIGYVFVYYYGLERRLLYGDFESAFNEILLLRKYHYNHSFETYSNSALIHACLRRKKWDYFHKLLEDDEFLVFNNLSLLILYSQQLDILPEMLLKLATKIPGTNRRYIKNHPDLYLQAITSELTNKFEKESYPFSSRYDIKKIPTIGMPVFANISLPPEIRTPQLPDFLRYEPFIKKIERKIKIFPPTQTDYHSPLLLILHPKKNKKSTSVPLINLSYFLLFQLNQLLPDKCSCLQQFFHNNRHRCLDKLP